jgi:NAD(P)-dependent dehydrogenase (short-subunit alcohol dehydrogenase family)
MLDQRVLDPSPDYFTYSISKSALFAATKTLAQALAPKIRVCGVGPGPTLKNVHQTDKEFEHEVARTLLKQGSPPETLLHAIHYLLSAKAVTGQMIAVDGGEHLVF